MVCLAFRKLPSFSRRTLLKFLMPFFFMLCKTCTERTYTTLTRNLAGIHWKDRMAQHKENHSSCSRKSGKDCTKAICLIGLCISWLGQRHQWLTLDSWWVFWKVKMRLSGYAPSGCLTVTLDFLMESQMLARKSHSVHSLAQATRSLESILSYLLALSLVQIIIFTSTWCSRCRVWEVST